MTVPADTTAPDEAPGAKPPGAIARRLGRRPLGVVLLALFGLFAGAQSLLAAFGIVAARYGSLGSLLSDHTQFEVVTFAYGVVFIAAAVAIWLLRSVGWYGTMLLAGTGLILQIALYIWNQPNYVTMAVLVASAFYLNQRQVKALFLQPPKEATTVVLEQEPGDQP